MAELGNKETQGPVIQMPSLVEHGQPVLPKSGNEDNERIGHSTALNGGAEVQTLRLSLELISHINYSLAIE